MIDSAIWDGQGSVAYTSAALTNVSPAFTNMVAASTAYFQISGAKTYSGGALIYGFTNGSYCVVSGSSDGPPVSNGPFGTGTLTLGADAALRAQTTGASTLGNAIALTGDVTFPTVAGEMSLIFSGNASLGATRTLTVQTGSTVPTAAVEFSGEISGSTFGIIKAGAGTLRLSGTNTYTGDTTVSNGTLALAVASLAPSSTVRVAEGAVLELNFAETNIVAGFVTNGVSLPAGVYNLNPALLDRGTAHLTSLLQGFYAWKGL
jgi:autotransporter-associated beta strand protein